MKKIKQYLLGFSNTQSVWTYLLLAGILFVGSYLRFQGTLTNSFAFTYDVGRDMLALLSIVHTHKIPLIGFTTGLPGVFYGPWWYLFLLIPYIVVGGNPTGIAGFIALTGVLAIVIAFILGRKISGNALGLLFALFVSVSPSLIASSSQIWNPNIAPFLVAIVFLIFLTMYMQKNMSWILFGVFGLLLGFMFDVEIVFGTLFFVSMISSSIIFLRKKITWVHIAAFVTGILIIFSPRVLFELRHHFLMTQTILHTFLSQPSQTSLLGAQAFQRSLFFLDLWKYSMAGQSLVVALCMILCTIVTSIVVFRKIPAVERMMLSVLWIVVGVFLLGLTFFSHDIWPHYTIGIPFVYALLFGFSLYFLRKIRYAKYGISIIVIFLALLNIQSVQSFFDIGKPLFTGDSAVYRNQVAVVDYVYHEAHGQKFKYIVYTPPVNDYTYQYLFAWYGKKVYGYTPERNEAHLFFVILEPDIEKPFRLVEWLKIREEDGTIIKEKKLHGGIIVQTRTVQ